MIPLLLLINQPLFVEYESNLLGIQMGTLVVLLNVCVHLNVHMRLSSACAGVYQVVFDDDDSSVVHNSGTTVGRGVGVGRGVMG